MINKPYLIFLGGITDPAAAKTGFGLRDWCANEVVGQYRLPGCTIDLGVAELTPAEAAAKGARSIIVGIAPDGGQLEASWVAALASAAAAGLDVVSGLHSRLESYDEIRQAAKATGVRLVNIRAYERDFGVATGAARSGKRVLMVGTDCALGKKYTALALARAMSELGLDVTFRATGQTGIMIAGAGIPIDAMIADFIAGAAEHLSPAAPDNHWDVIEGQGSLFHPSYAGVTLGLIHGSQPHRLILCHDPRRLSIDGLPGFPIPPLATVITRYEEAARLTNPEARVCALSLNTAGLVESAAQAVISAAIASTRLPCTDPVRFGPSVLVEAVLA